MLLCHEQQPGVAKVPLSRSASAYEDCKAEPAARLWRSRSQALLFTSRKSARCHSQRWSADRGGSGIRLRAVLDELVLISLQLVRAQAFACAALRSRSIVG